MKKIFLPILLFLFMFSGISTGETNPVSASNGKSILSYGNFVTFESESNLLLADPPIPVIPYSIPFLANIYQTFIWTKSDSSVSYTLQISKDQDFNVVEQLIQVIGDIDTVKLTIPLDYHTNYWWRIKGDNTAFSNPMAFHTELEPPVALLPSNNAVNVSVEPTLDWTDVAGGYIWEISKELDSLGLPKNPIVGWATDRPITLPHTLNQAVGTLIIPDGFLTGNTTYYWRVKSFEATVYNSIYTPVQKFKTIPEVIPFPSWPIGGAQVYSYPVQLFWYLNQSSIGVTYDLYYSVNSDMSDSVKIADLTSGNYTINAGLTPNTTYYWQIKAKKSGVVAGVSEVDSFLFTPPGSTLSVPVASWPIGGATVYSTSQSLFWYLNSSSAGLKYHLQVSTVPGDYSAALINEDDLTSMNYALTNLNPGTTYYWHVRSKTITGDYSAFSDEESFIVYSPSAALLVPVPSWPVDNAEVYSTDQTLYWYLNTNSTGLKYHLQVSTVSGDYSAALINQDDLTAMNYSLTNLTAGQTYYWQVRTKTAAGTYSDFADEESFTVVGGAGIPVQPIASWPIGGNSVYSTTQNLYWYLNSSSAGLTYKVEVTKVSGDYSAGNLIHEEDGIAVMNTAVDSLINGQTYYWRVYSSDGTVYSAPSLEESFIVNASGGTPLVPILSWPVDDASIYSTPQALYWYIDGNSSGLVYNLRVSTNPEFSAPLFLSLDDIGVGNYTLNGLQEGQTYYWKVQSKNSSGVTSDFSDVESFTYVAPSSPVIPILGNPVGNIQINSNSPVLSWRLPVSIQNNVSYTVEYSETPDFTNGSVISGLNNLNMQLTNLGTNKTYYWRVKAVNDQGVSSTNSFTGSFHVLGALSVMDELNNKEFELMQNYPNPFNPTTRISFRIPVESRVKLELFNIMGEKIATLIDETRAAGSHNYELSLRQVSDYNLSSGVYFYRLQAGEMVSVKKMVLMK